jgi:hypothetical protein
MFEHGHPENCVPTPYTVLFRVDIGYKALCSQEFFGDDLNRLRETIARDYDFEVDTLPITTQGRHRILACNGN